MAFRYPARFVIVTSIALFSAVPCSHAEETDEPTVLPEIEVNAERESLTVPALETVREKLKTVPGGTNVQTSEQIRQGRASTLKDALDFLPGVMVQSRFGAEEARLSIRGSGLQRTFHGSGLTLLQDGVPLNLADGSFDFQAVEPLFARYIEVYRGANALQYGSTTLGGAIHFVSPTGYDSDALQARVEAGSFGYFRGQASSGRVVGEYDYAASLTHFYQDGFRRHSEQNTQRFFANAGRKISPRLESRVYVTYVHTDSDLPGYLTKTQLETDPELAASANVTNDWERNFTLLRLADKTTYLIGDGRIEGSAFWSRKKLHHPIAIVIDQTAHDFGGDLKYAREGFALGVRPLFGTIHDERYVNSGGNSGAKTADADLSAANLSLYSELEIPIAQSIALFLGAQGTYARRANRDRFPTSGSDLDNSDHQEFWGLSPKLGARYDWDPFTQIFANLSRSFEPPTFGELVAVSGQNGLLDLDAQKATTLEIGSRGSRERFAWDASYYRAWIRRELLQYEISPGTTRTLNAGATLHEGIELGLKAGFFDQVAPENAAHPSHRLAFSQSYAWNHFRFSDDPTFGNNRLAGLPRHFYRAELLYQDPLGFYFGPNLEKTFGRSAVDFANTLFAEPYAILGIKTGYRSAKGFSGFIEVRNLANRRYAASTGVIARATAGNSNQFLPGDGRAIYGGLEWKL